jgi:glyoxylase-like metal-dependent hydrolase (beta-lactamase superfamily II)
MTRTTDAAAQALPPATELCYTGRYDAYAIRYDTHRLARNHYFSPIVVDEDSRPELRGRSMLIHPVDALTSLGVQPSDVTDIVVTHCHYDPHRQPRRIPESEADRAAHQVGLLGQELCAVPPEPAHVHDRPQQIRYVLDLADTSRLRVVDGPAELFPGIRVELVPGHAAGSQAVLMDVEDGSVVFASDAVHYYDEPFV